VTPPGAPLTRADLEREIETEARREPFPLDEPVYREADRDPLRPILSAGDLDAPVAFLARDLGAQEVRRGEPLIGPAGAKVRDGLAAAGCRALLTNTVPFKPPGNRAYSQKVRNRFRPSIALLLVALFRGETIVTLGNQAFEWFAPFDDRARFRAFWADPDRRYRETLEIEIAASWGQRTLSRRIALAPLPHPSPLNQRWYRAFPDLLAVRLEAVMGRSRGGS
jgi:uracil-DNA glycosylase